MKTVVTGGAGFIGHNLVGTLLEQGDQVTVVDDLSKGEAKNLTSFTSNPNFRFVRGNLLKADTIRNAIDSETEVIFHLAALIGGIGYFHTIPATLRRDNDIMTYHVFEAAREGKCKVTYLSSSMVYERATQFPSPESHIEECGPPITSYGFSKLSGEYIAQAYADEFKVPFVVCRPFNAYGPGEVPGDYVGYSHVIPDLVAKILASSDETIELLGDGNQTRCFTYAKDLAQGIALVGKKADNDVFNIGNEQETRISDLAKMIWKCLGKTGEPRFLYSPTFKDDVKRRVPDCTKIREKFGWKPRTSLEEGLRTTVSWLVEKLK